MLSTDKVFTVLVVIGALLLLWDFISLYVEGKNYVDSEDDEEMSLSELKAECEVRGLKVKKGMDKDQLIEMLEDYEEKKQIGENMKFVGIVGIVGILGCVVVGILHLLGVV